LQIFYKFTISYDTILFLVVIYFDIFSDDGVAQPTTNGRGKKRAVKRAAAAVTTSSDIGTLQPTTARGKRRVPEKTVAELLAAARAQKHPVADPSTVWTQGYYIDIIK
jgi:hypothetical protein